MEIVNLKCPLGSQVRISVGLYELEIQGSKFRVRDDRNQQHAGEI